MNPLDQRAVVRALVNVSQSERSAVAPDPGWDDIPWAALDFHGWRDRKFPQRGYLVRERPDGLVAVALRAPDTRMSAARKAMCSICQAVDTANSVVLFSARRAGPAGRRGDTVGTYVCTGLDCSAQLRMPRNRVGRSMLSDRPLDPDELAVGMLARLDGFLGSVLQR